MKKGRKRFRFFTTLLFILLFLWTSLLPTPVLAAEAVGEWLAEQNFDDPDLVDSFLGLFASGEKKQQKREEAMEDQMLPRNEGAPVGRKKDPPKIKGELTGKRNANAKFYELSDGRIQAEIASGPIHYKDSKGKWQDIDPSITATDTEPGFAFGNKKTPFIPFLEKSRSNWSSLN